MGKSFESNVFRIFLYFCNGFKTFFSRKIQLRIKKRSHLKWNRTSGISVRMAAASALPDTGTNQELDERACGDRSSCKDTAIRSIGIFPILVWEKIFTHVKNPLDVQSLCKSSEDLNQLLDDSGRKGQEYFFMVYPLIRPYLGAELELLVRDYPPIVISASPVFLVRASNYNALLNLGIFGTLRQVCPYWRKIVWIDGVQRLRAKYTMLDTPDDLRGFPRFLILCPPVFSAVSKKKKTRLARELLINLRQAFGRNAGYVPVQENLYSQFYPTRDIEEGTAMLPSNDFPYPCLIEWQIPEGAIRI